MKRLVAVYDKAARAFLSPHFVMEIGQATRDFEDATKDEKSVISQHPEDYDLYYIADFDDQSGEVILKEGSPIKLMSGLNQQLKNFSQDIQEHIDETEVEINESEEIIKKN